MNPLDPSSFNHAFATVNTIQYHYIDQCPTGHSSKPAIVLVHGFPDLWYGWRHQVRPLVEAGHRVIVPSTVGYPDSEAPLPYEYYTLKRIASDLLILLSSLGIDKAVYIGHDWGSMIVQRVALWFPEKVLAVASVCVPFTQPQGTYIPIKQLVKRLPNFAYQIYFASPEAEQDLSSPENIERFLKALYRVNGDGPISWNSDRNLVAGLGNPTLSKLWETQDVWKFYLSSFQRVGSLRGPLTYYKTRELNYNEELGLEGEERIQCPAMFVGAMDDRALPPAMWENQQWVPHLERHAVGGGHWCLVENGGTEVGKVIQEWVTKVSNTSSKL